jgi:hypothetical protein
MKSVRARIQAGISALSKRRHIVPLTEREKGCILALTFSPLLSIKHNLLSHRERLWALGYN